MSSTPTTTSSTPAPNTVSASAYLHLAPTNSAPAYTRDEVRQLVLEYLCSSCYADSAKAFAKEVDRRDEEERAGQSSSGGADEGVVVRNKGRELKRKESVYGMQGVEATPPPAAALGDEDGMAVEQDDEDELGDEREVQRRLTKSVAFEVDPDGVHLPPEHGDPEEDWSMLSKDQLEQVRLRRDVRDAILSGQIQSAVDLLTEHFPSVLSEPTPASTTFGSSKAPPCTPQTFFVATPSTSTAPPTSAASSTSQVPILGASFGAWSISLEPTILALNLQLQTFVELMRSAHSFTSTASTPSSTTANGNGHSHLSDSLMSTSTSSLSSSTAHSMNVAIAQSQALNARVQKLPKGKEREQWERECVDVSGLLAYKDLSTCPVRGYLAQERRECLSEMVNAAILQRTSHTPLPLLALAARQTTALWSTLAEFKVQFPPPQPGDRSAGKDKEKGRNRTYPRFDVRTFLGESEVQEPVGEGAPRP